MDDRVQSQDRGRKEPVRKDEAMPLLCACSTPAVDPAAKSLFNPRTWRNPRELDDAETHAPRRKARRRRGRAYVVGDGGIVQEAMEDACKCLPIGNREPRYPTEGGAGGIGGGSPAQIDADAQELMDVVEAIPGRTSKEEARRIVLPGVGDVANAQVRGDWLYTGITRGDPVPCGSKQEAFRVP